jgi:hypothetical protein
MKLPGEYRDHLVSLSCRCRSVSCIVIGRPADDFASVSQALHMRFFQLLLWLALSTLVVAQAAPEKGGNEVQIWAGGGHSVSGGRGDTGIFNAGLRYGWILTDPHLPSFLRGCFEYVLDAVPIFLAF